MVLFVLVEKESLDSNWFNRIEQRGDSLRCASSASVLCPLFFFVYVNDIYRCSQIFDFYLFADDTNLLYSNKDLETVVNG